MTKLKQTKSSQTTSLLEYVTLRRIRVQSTGQEFPKHVPFPSDIEGANYPDLLANKIIATFADFQKIDPGKCQGCGE